MASITVKSTYSLDLATAKTMELLAKLWQVPKSEVLRRAIAKAAQEESLSPSSNPQLQAFCSLQKKVNLTPKQTRTWQKEIEAAWNEAGRKLSSK